MTSRLFVHSLSEQWDIWYQQQPGRSLAAVEQRALGEVLQQLFGYHLLQVGGANIIDLTSSSPILNKVRLDPEISVNFRGLQVQGDTEELPFLSKTFDVIVLPHVLEFAKHPLQLLQEAYDLLIAGGYVVILGFNPRSLWKISKAFSKQENVVPWQGTFIRYGKLRQWLTKLNLQVELYSTYFFRPAFKKSQLLKQTLFMEAVGQLCWASAGAVYVLVAQKVESGITLVGSPWQKEKRVIKAARAELGMGQNSENS